MSFYVALSEFPSGHEEGFTFCLKNLCHC